MQLMSLFCKISLEFGMTSASSPLTYRPDIDGLRAIAVLSVFVYHARPGLLTGGFVGVDVFFVISGFLISSILVEGNKSGRFTYADFYQRRILRILPAMVLVMFASWVAGWFLLTADEFRRLGGHLASGTVFLSNVTYWRDVGYFDGDAATKPFLHLWSLSVEEQFYLFWPAFIVLAWPLGPRKVLAATAAVAAASFALNLALVSEHPVTAFFLPHTRFWELLIGAGLSLAAMPVLSAATRNFISIFGIGAIAVAALLFNGGDEFPGWRALVPTLGALLLVIAGPHAWVNRHVLGNRVLVAIGLISYPLYLWHWPLLVFQNLLAHDAHPRWTKLVAVVLAFVLAGLTYQLVERPIRFGRSPSRRRVAAVALGSLLTCLLAIGLSTALADGFPNRFPSKLRFLAMQPKPAKEPARTCFLEPEQTSSDFARECGLGQVLVWGDSHAEHLMPGLVKLASERTGRPVMTIGQYTASACPPIVDYSLPMRRHCRDINDFVLAEITRSTPKTVVLAGNWSGYEYERIEATIVRLHSIGTKVVLVGPVPIWDKPLAKNLLFLGLDGAIPERLVIAAFPQLEVIDGKLAEIASHAGATYLSPLRMLCDSKGCLTGVGQGTVTSFDRTHLTGPASVFVGVGMRAALFSASAATGTGQ